jgi:hypothetical protein
MKPPVTSALQVFWKHLLAHPATWFVMAAVFLFLDFITSPTIQFPITLVFPVALAAWNRGIRWGMFFAIVPPVTHFVFSFFEDAPWSMLISATNLVIRLMVLCGFAYLVAHTGRQRLRIQSLERLLPVCAWCRKIRTGPESWQTLDLYLAEQAEMAFTHTVCPDCANKQLHVKLQA